MWEHFYLIVHWSTAFGVLHYAHNCLDLVASTEYMMHLKSMVWLYDCSSLKGLIKYPAHKSSADLLFNILKKRKKVLFIMSSLPCWEWRFQQINIKTAQGKRPPLKTYVFIIKGYIFKSLLNNSQMSLCTDTVFSCHNQSTCLYSRRRDKSVPFCIKN